MFSNTLLYLLAAASTLLAFYYYKLYSEEQKQNRTLAEEINQLKMEQHDFKHHLQLLFTLQQMKKYDEALGYIKGLVRELKQGEVKGYSGLPVLDALLSYKRSLAAGENIKLEVDIKADLSQLPLSCPGFCKIIGNLLDNGIEYLRENSLEKSLLQLKITESTAGYLIKVSNPVAEGLPLPGGVEGVFKPYSSSKGRGRGLGLAVVSKLVREAGGEVKTRLDRGEKTITFTIKLPRGSSPFRVSAEES